METWSYGEGAEPKRFPWPPPEDGAVLAAFGETWKSAVLDPGAFFRALPPRQGAGPAILYYLVLGILLAGVGLFWDVTGFFTSAAGEEAVAGEAGFGTLDPVVGFLLSPLLLMLGLLLSAGITHLVLLVFGGARNGFGTTLRVFCYAYSPMIFGVVPILGTVIGAVWMVVLAIIGLREAHQTEGWKAGVAVLLPFLVLVGLVIFAFIVLAAAGVALLGGLIG